MSREIKFRAWDGRGMCLFDSIYFGDLHVSFTNGTFTYIDDEASQYRQDKPLMQYTGLKDKNGVEIYEGDIVEYETNYYGNRKVHAVEVKWYDDLEHDGFGEPLAVGYIFRGSNNKVIGNIYENPKLVAKSQ